MAIHKKGYIYAIKANRIFTTKVTDSRSIIITASGGKDRGGTRSQHNQRPNQGLHITLQRNQQRHKSHRIQQQAQHVR